jgi:hypothetical protein
MCEESRQRERKKDRWVKRDSSSQRGSANYLDSAASSGSKLPAWWMALSVFVK